MFEASASESSSKHAEKAQCIEPHDSVSSEAQADGVSSGGDSFAAASDLRIADALKGDGICGYSREQSYASPPPERVSAAGPARLGPQVWR